MNYRIKIFGISIVFVSIAISVASYTRLHAYKASVNEGAFSLCANAYSKDITLNEKAELIGSYLTFADIPQKEKEKLITAVKNNSYGTKELFNELCYFEYNYRNIQELCEKIRNLSTEKETFSISKYMSSEELVAIMLEEIFDNNSTLKVITGDGNSFIKRYYCSNVCIDVCENGKLRYLSDIKGGQGEDMFLKWLKSGREVIVKNVTTWGTLEYQEIESQGFSGSLCINLENGHVFAAEIIINSSTE